MSNFSEAVAAMQAKQPRRLSYDEKQARAVLVRCVTCAKEVYATKAHPEGVPCWDKEKCGRQLVTRLIVGL